MTAFLTGSAGGGAAVGAVLGLVGETLRRPWGTGSTRLWVLAGVIALGVAMDVRAAGMGLPTVRRQVNEDWLHRYREGGLEALRELGRAPRRHPNQTPEEIEQAVLELRRGHMTWGARKLKRVLERDHPGRRWPAASTMGAMLAREGLVVRRRKRQRTHFHVEPG